MFTLRTPSDDATEPPVVPMTVDVVAPPGG
jgi:hypothetical protein